MRTKESQGNIILNGTSLLIALWAIFKFSADHKTNDIINNENLIKL